MLYRLAEHADDGAVLAAFEQLEISSPHYRFSRRPSARMGFDYYWEAKQRGDAYIIDGTWLLLVNGGRAWHGHDTCLEEALVLRCYPRSVGHIQRIPEALEAIAVERKVDAVLVHDSSLGFRMGNVYDRAGFIPITHTYYKELNYGSMDR